MEISGIPFDDNGLTMLPSLQLTLYSDFMSCAIGWCRFVAQRSECLTTRIHRHTVCEFHYVLEGRLTFRFDEDIEEIVVGKDEFALIPANCAHRIICDDPQTRKLVIGFSIQTEAPPINAVLNDAPYPRHSKASPIMGQISDALAIKASNANLMRAMSVRYIIDSLILEAVDTLTCAEGLGEGMGISGSEAYKRDILSFIQNNAFGQLRTQDVAQHMGFEKRQANRICQKAFNCTISQLIVKIRLQQVHELLDQTEFSLSEIAEIAGFSSVYAFSRFFRVHFGISPGRYRRQHHANDA